MKKVKNHTLELSIERFRELKKKDFGNPKDPFDRRVFDHQNKSRYYGDLRSIISPLFSPNSSFCETLINPALEFYQVKFDSQNPDKNTLDNFTRLVVKTAVNLQKKITIEDVKSIEITEKRNILENAVKILDKRIIRKTDKSLFKTCEEVLMYLQKESPFELKETLRECERWEHYALESLSFFHKFREIITTDELAELELCYGEVCQILKKPSFYREIILLSKIVTFCFHEKTDIPNKTLRESQEYFFFSGAMFISWKEFFSAYETLIGVVYETENNTKAPKLSGRDQRIIQTALIRKLTYKDLFHMGVPEDKVKAGRNARKDLEQERRKWRAQIGQMCDPYNGIEEVFFQKKIGGSCKTLKSRLLKKAKGSYSKANIATLKKNIPPYS